LAKLVAEPGFGRKMLEHPKPLRFQEFFGGGGGLNDLNCGGHVQ
jgi:hypothetical protein